MFQIKEVQYRQHATVLDTASTEIMLSFHQQVG